MRPSPPTPLSCVILMVVLIVPAILPSAATGQTPLTGSVELAFRSKYLFAGIPFAADEVTQLKVTAGTGSFTLNAFSTYDHAASDLSEGDLYGDYYVQVAPKVGVFVGAAVYSFKIGGQWETTPELYGGLALTAPLNPTVFVAHDFDLGDGTHAQLTLSHDVPLGTSGVAIRFVANLDYNDHYYVQTSGFSYADVGASLQVPVGPITLSPTLLIHRGIEEGFIDEEVFGVAASLSF